MSLFVCENCSKVENHSSIYKDGVRPGDVEGQWNMGFMEMCGNGDKDLTITKDGKEYIKKANSIYMLCYECNTGESPTDNERPLADADEVELSKYSKYRYITPSDHEDGAIIGSYNNEKLNPIYRDMHNAFRDIAVQQVKGLLRVHETCHLENNKYLLGFSIIYKIYMEDKLNFKGFNSEYNFDWNDPIFLFDFISKCLIDVKLSKSSTYKKFKNIIINNADKGNIISSVLYYVNGTIPEEIKRALDKTKGKVHWKDLQTESNKKFMVLKAETKQLVKKYNKENGTKLKVPTTLEQIKLVREEMGLDIKL